MLHRASPPPVAARRHLGISLASHPDTSDHSKALPLGRGHKPRGLALSTKSGTLRRDLSRDDHAYVVDFPKPDIQERNCAQLSASTTISTGERPVSNQHSIKRSSELELFIGPLQTPHPTRSCGESGSSCPSSVGFPS